MFFTALTGNNGGGSECPSGALGPVHADTLYARVDGEQADAHTVAISAPQCGAGSSPAEVACQTAPPAAAEFAGASQDGSHAFFLSTQQLTDHATEGPGAALGNNCAATVFKNEHNGCNLYADEGVGSAHPLLVDVSEGAGGAPVPGGPRVQGVMALSPDGSHVYFVAQGVLTTTERPGCVAEWAAAGRRSEAPCHAVEGADNLYVYDTATARTSFVTIMAATESEIEQWSGADGLANVTPDGRFLVFASHGDLTADDTSRSGAAQVFRYDAESGGASSLTRISIGNEGFDDNGNRSAPTPCYNNDQCAEDAHIARVPTASLSGARPDPTMSEDGSRVFFMSPVALTPRALDDVQIALEEKGGHEFEQIYARNVYEWEQEGVGSCPEGRAAGCVFLISDGRDVNVNSGDETGCETNRDGGNVASAVCLLGTDRNGDNVFLTTADQLVPSDTNTELDYYDARVCEPENGNPCVSSPSTSSTCTGEECHGVPSGVPGVPAAPSATFNGSGNVTAPALAPVKPKALTRAQKLAKALRVCRKDKKKAKRVACEKTARKKYGPPATKKNTKKTSHKGRTSP